MAIQTVFERYELKFLLTLEQKQKCLEVMQPYMRLDNYGRTTIRNIYYDTDSYLLVRRSIEKPVYKEKLRIRSYQHAFSDGSVFVELKKKYKSRVYKRRISLPEQDALNWLEGRQPCCENTQISTEVDYFMKHYQTLHPTVFLSYQREAYYSLEESDFRITFDDCIFARLEEFSLNSEIYGTPLLPQDMVLMEIKCSGGIPLWMTSFLSREHLSKISFSKYGLAYKKLIFPQAYPCYIHEKKEDLLHE